MPSTVITTGQVKLMAELYNECNMSCKEVAEELGISHPTVSRHLRQQGIILRRQSPPKRFDHRTELAIYNSQASQYELARQYGCRQVTIYDIKKRIRAMQQRRPTKDIATVKATMELFRKKVVEHREAGLDGEAHRLNCDVQALENVLDYITFLEKR